MFKTAIFLIVLGCAATATAIYILSQQEFNLPGLFLTLSFMAISNLGIGLLFFNKPYPARKKIAWILLSIGLLFLLALWVMRYYHVPGLNMLLIEAVLFFCFTYMPLLVKNRFEKWKIYTPNQWLLFFLCIGDLFSIITNLLGYLFKTMHWPGGRIMQYIGIVLLLLVFLGWNQTFKRVVRKRKEAEDRLSKTVDELNEKQKEITDSINYARRIQYSLLAHDEMLEQNLSGHFVFFKPKDIVSGDFYWCTKKDQNFYLAVCDCTGHGVPGAFMSLLNISFLNEAINEKNIAEPHHVFNHVRKRLIQNMEGAQDGMDGTLIKFSPAGITYASAQNCPVLVRNGKLTELPSDSMPVGKGEIKKDFQLFNLPVEKNDCIYFYTDGFADQFGGEKGKKFKYKNLNELLLKLSPENSNTIHSTLESTFKKWKGDLEQVDDVCVIGVRI